MNANKKERKNKMIQPTVVITGGSSGIGQELARVYAAHHYQVYTLSRRVYSWKEANIRHLGCDITKAGDLQLAASEIAKAGHPVDILICCAGYGIAGVTEETSLESARQQFDVNFFGAFLTIQNFLPLLKKKRGSKILFISSVAGEIALPYQSFYSASKAAMNKLLEAWQLELKPFGIKVSSFLLGDIKTDFTAHRQAQASHQPHYRKKLADSIAKMAKDEQTGMSANYVAKVIFKRSQRKYQPPVQTIGWQYHLFLLLQRILPRKLVLFLVGLLYA